MNKRILAFDVMRVVAAFAVVWQHIGGQGWPDSFPSSEWEARNVIVSFAQWSVPVFFMISGALFLSPDKPLDIKRLYRKNILRIVYAFLFWSAIYVIYTEGLDNLKIAFVSVLKGPAPFWFLKSMIGIYIFVPVLKAIAENRQIFRYFVMVAVILTFVVSQLLDHIGIFNAQRMILWNEYLDTFGIKSLGVVTYFILGYYLYAYSFGKRVRYAIYVLGVLSFFLSAVGTHYFSDWMGRPFNLFYDDMHPFTLIEAVAIFLFIKNHADGCPLSIRRYLIVVSNYSLGIYLVHPLIVTVLNDQLAFNSSTLDPHYFPPIFATIVFILSFVVVRLVSFVPGLRKTVA